MASSTGLKKMTATVTWKKSINSGNTAWKSHRSKDIFRGKKSKSLSPTSTYYKP